MSLTYIEKLRGQFNKVKEANDLPQDVIAMTELQQLLSKIYIYTGTGNNTHPLADHAAAITTTISKIVDGRIERILCGLEEDARRAAGPSQ